MSETIKELKPIQFSNTIGKDFNSTLNKRVRKYFKDNNITKYGNTNMVVKSIFMLTLYLVPLAFLLSGQITGFWTVFGLYLIMGFGTAGIGLSIMHDANHGAYSKNDKINFWMGRTVSLIGGFAVNWKIQHNVLHHTYTNIHGYDEDISPINMLRFSPDDTRRPIHKLQYIFAWLLYGLMTFMWLTTKDFKQVLRYKKMNLTKTVNESFGTIIAELIISKIVYYIIVIVLPMIILAPYIQWYWFLLFIFCMHFIAGFLFGIIFQSAHVVSETEFVQPDKESSVENNFAIHQMQTTANFAPGSRVFAWLIGGLNYQVEHHLFPTICHIHYKNLSPIVEETAKEFGVPYNTNKTFFGALRSHGKMLYKLGRE